MKCSIYTAEGKDFSLLVGDILKNCELDGKIVRLVFFGRSWDNKDYLKQRQEIERQVRVYFGISCPSFSYVAQKPLVADLALEVHRIDTSFEGEILYREYQNRPYVILRGRNYRELIAGGMCGKEVDAPLRVQAEEAMECMRELLTKEEFAINGIVRQWNYIERITEFDGDCQRYQAFNEVRSRFYAAAAWNNDYPAATGIGMQWGGIVIDFTVVEMKGSECRCESLNNALQIAAYVYSQRVLLGKLSEDQSRVTPKFERAKVLDTGNEGIIYISGTAAIRGEQSLVGVGVLQQTKITLENIDFLISGCNLQKRGIIGEGKVRMIRVYLKYPADLAVVKKYVSQQLKEIPAIYLLADICRKELLVEVEGIALIKKE